MIGIVRHHGNLISNGVTKGECKLENPGDYERRIEALVEQCDDQIEQFKASLEKAGPEQKEKYDEEMSVLIANREAVRRGLLRPTPDGEELCSSCPQDESGGKTAARTTGSDRP
jgi:hypothetical protein